MFCKSIRRIATRLAFLGVAPMPVEFPPVGSASCRCCSGCFLNGPRRFTCFQGKPNKGLVEYQIHWHLQSLADSYLRKKLEGIFYFLFLLHQIHAVASEGAEDQAPQGSLKTLHPAKPCFCILRGFPLATLCERTPGSSISPARLVPEISTTPSSTYLCCAAFEGWWRNYTLERETDKEFVFIRLRTNSPCSEAVIGFES